MAIMALTFDQETDFISRHDPDEENPTTWKLGVIDAMLHADISDEVMDFSVDVDSDQKDDVKSAKTKLHMNRRNIEIVRFGLKGWKHFVDADSNEVPFKTRPVTRVNRKFDVINDTLLNMIPPAVVRELAEELLKINGLSEGELKNSG